MFKYSKKYIKLLKLEIDRDNELIDAYKQLSSLNDKVVILLETDNNILRSRLYK